MLFKNKLNSNYIYFCKLKENIKKLGPWWFIKKLLFRLIKEFLWFLLIPVSLVLHVLRFRLLPIKIEHIGHLTTEIDTFLKAKELGLLSKKYYYFMLAPTKKISNLHLLNYWRPHLTIINNDNYCKLLNILTKRFFMQESTYIYSVNHFGAQPIYRINSLWGKRSSLLSLSQEDEIFSQEEFIKLGIPKGKWFICLHVREGGFLPENESIQSHRNASIENTLPAMKKILERGGMVIRMGDKTMTRIPAIEGIIDYAHSPLKSERMDIVLCAKAKFFLGCTSGLSFLSMIFGVPIAHVNMIPFTTLGIRYCDLSIPKLLLKLGNKNYLSFKEIMSKDFGNFFYTYQYAEAGITYEENSADDITDIVTEMLDKLENTFVTDSLDNDLHKSFNSLFENRHYSYLASSQIGTCFLRKYKNLLA